MVYFAGTGRKLEGRLGRIPLSLEGSSGFLIMMRTMLIILYSMPFSAPLTAYKETVLESNVEKTDHMSMFRQRSVDHIHKIKKDNRSFEVLANFKYVVTTSGIQNFMHAEN